MKKNIIANWKMNPKTAAEAVTLAEQIEQHAAASTNVEVVVAAPFLFLPFIREKLKSVKLGAQNVFWKNPIGAFTGEVSAVQLSEFGVTHVIIGHSERRANLGESDDMVNMKVLAALEVGLKPVICVGELTHDDTNFITGLKQLTAAVQNVSAAQAKNLIVVYEPVWAISTNPNAAPAIPQNAINARGLIEKFFTDTYGSWGFGDIQILYGGSVNPENIESFLSEGKMDGALVGGASLDAEKFGKMIEIANGVVSL